MSLREKSKSIQLLQGKRLRVKTIACEGCFIGDVNYVSGEYAFFKRIVFMDPALVKSGVFRDEFRVQVKHIITVEIV